MILIWQIHEFDAAQEAVTNVISYYKDIEDGRVPIWSMSRSEAEKKATADSVFPGSGVASDRSIFTFDQYCLDRLFPAF